MMRSVISEYLYHLILQQVNFCLFLTKMSIYSFPPEVVTRVTYDRMRTPMRNARLSQFPNPPADLRALTAILMDPHNAVITMSDDGQDNLYSGSVTDANGDHHVMFFSNRMVEVMRNFSVLHSDGTFKTVPVNVEFASQVSLY